MSKAYKYAFVFVLLIWATVIFFMGFNGTLPSPARLMDHQSKVACLDKLPSEDISSTKMEWMLDASRAQWNDPYQTVHMSDNTNLRLVRTSNRKFTSTAVDNAIREISSKMKDSQLSILFQNCLPNTLDTTVNFRTSFGPQNELDSFVITGDIEALWLRDSTNQVWPYLRFANEDSNLSNMIKGLINRQIRSVLLDPYANAFHDDATNMGGHYDRTDKKPGVFERKYELDSLASVIRLSVGFYEATGDVSVFDERWAQGIDLVLNTIIENQHPESRAYTFLRNTDQPTETLLHGFGNPVRNCGLSRSPFRPSDDSTILPYLIPANAMAETWINRMVQANLLSSKPEIEKKAKNLVQSLQRGINMYGIVQHPYYGRVYAYEVDGFGGQYLSDDANVPSLISLPYLKACSVDDPVYQATRKMLLSPDNPWYFSGTAASGIGSPHGNGPNWIWPMSIIMRALTSNNDTEILQCLTMLKRSSADTGFMHESFHKDDPKQFTRSWFAWANTLFGELILTLAEEKPYIIFS